MDHEELARLTRSQFLRAAGGAAAGFLALGGTASEALGRAGQRRARVAGAGAGSEETRSFRSRPDLHPPRITVASRRSGEASDGCWFLAPGKGGQAQTGPLIVDARGRVVWFRPLPTNWFVMNFRSQRYRGEPVLTWWQGTLTGLGEGVILDSRYREIGRVRAGNGRQLDPHELLLTPEGTALVTCSPAKVSADLRSVGGSRNGYVSESILQEIDLASGRMLWEWRSLDHLSVSESYMPRGGVYDFMHANSIDVMPDGNLLVSGRHTWAVYKLDRGTGKVIWRLGGKRSDFEMGPHSQFTWQHDGRSLDARTITVFDDGAAFFEGSHPARESHSQSRGLVLHLDIQRGTVRRARSYHHDPALLAYGFGNMQTLPDGDVLVGWGNLPTFSHYAAGGSLLHEIRLPLGYASYRGYRARWRATPTWKPALAVRRNRTGPGRTLYASWNGATGVAAWRVSTGRTAGALRPVTTAKHRGFETAIEIRSGRGFAAVTALDRAGHALGSSAPVGL